MAPLILWRLVKQKHVATAFSGEGAAWFGGRWNPIGLPVVYLSETLSLAALEFLVHLTLEDRRLLFAAISVEVPEGVAFETLEPAALPTNWRDESVPEETQKIGADWAAKKQSVLLQVPSVVIPNEHNYLANPHHPDCSRLIIQPPQPFSFDPRLAR
jgi:RES domain-containing protein